MSAMRGLTIFISDIRNSQSKEEEQKRVEKELAHIRQQFAKKDIDGYGLKKYIWKLLYTYMLGYDIEVGHMEALKLITSSKFTEKNSGYMACQLLWNENTEYLRLLVQTVKKDLSNTQNEIFQCLALHFIANIGGMEFAESLAIDVKNLLISGRSRSFVRKKAALTLLRLFRKYPDCLPQDDFAPKLIAILDDPNLGVVTSVMSLLLGLVSYSTKTYEEAPAKAVYVLGKLVGSREKRSVYRYYLTLCPWLQVKLLRLLQYFPPPADTQVMQRLNAILKDILTKTVMTKNVNKNNADHSILFEAINVIIHLSMCGVQDLQTDAITLLGKFLTFKEPNFRYLGLETLTRLANFSGALPAIRSHHDVILASLHDSDVSIRKRSLDLLYVMCDKSTANSIVDALVEYLSSAPYEMREELVLKIAILAERFANELRWYVDVILKLISLAGDYVTDDIWHRVVQIVTNTDDLQEYAATTCYTFLNDPHVHENGVKVGAYILGEFGDQIKDESLGGHALMDVLETHFGRVSSETKALLLSAYIKLANAYPDIKERVNSVFDKQRSSVDTEIQQRACEYYVMNTTAPAKLMDTVFEVMPNFNERENVLLKRIKKQQKATTDRDVWTGDEEKRQVGEDDDDEDDSDEDDDDEDDEDDSDSDSDDGEDRARSAQTMDLLSGFGDFDQPMNGGGASSSVSFPSQDSSILQPLYAKERGVLYETKDLQVGYQVSNEQAHIVKFALYFGNRLSSSLTNLTANVADSELYKVKIDGNGVEVPPKKQTPLFISFMVLRPFKAPITANLKFAYAGKPHSLNLQLPLTVGRFSTPAALEGGAFMESWKRFGTNETQGTRKGSNVSNNELQQVIQNALRLGLVANVEKNPDNFVAAGTFHTGSKNPQGAFITMPVLVRVETKPGMFRATVHSGHQAVSDAVLHSLTIASGTHE
jgi:AP-2 complex subunit alpha